MVEEVPTDVLEGVEGRFWHDGGHGRLGRGVAIAHSTAVPSGCDVLCHPWPEQGGFCAGGHPACALVGCVEGVQAGAAKLGWDDDPVSVCEDPIHCREGVPEGGEVTCCRRHQVSFIGRAFFDDEGEFL